MAETLLQFQFPVIGPDGTPYEARACGGPMPRTAVWEGWLEFIPIGGGAPARSGRETTQPNRTDTEYWATGLTRVYLEGALRRALAVRRTIAVSPPQPSMFASPAPPVSPPLAGEPASVLNPFSVYGKGEALLRHQLRALSSWHLVNIAIRYELSAHGPETLNRMSGADLIALIVAGVREETGAHRVQKQRPDRFRDRASR